MYLADRWDGKKRSDSPPTRVRPPQLLIPSSQFGIGIVSVRIGEIVLRDERAVLPIGSYNERFGVTLSLPSVIGRNGVIRILEPEMSVEEKQALERSAASLKKSGDGI